MSPDARLDNLLKDIRACTLCKAHLPLGPRPALHVGPHAKILIIGQAPGTRVHKTGQSWNDPSGDKLREWLGLSRDQFYDTENIAITSLGFCYPGKGSSGDLPPRPECAPQWHGKLRALMPDIKLTLLIGSYAQAYYLGDRRKKTLTETVQNWREYVPMGYLPLVHPSPRNRMWLKRNAWFETEVVPELRRVVSDALGLK
jgi:uracil-DNA glycosylase